MKPLSQKLILSKKNYFNKLKKSFGNFLTFETRVSKVR
jgi:hypothetical protein